MLFLLLKTRLVYYKNYLKHHFDRTTMLEIFIIVAVLLMLLMRSPADIGYNFKWMSDEAFPLQWARLFGTYALISFYLVAEIFAFFALRISREWQLLGALPVGRKTIADYYLIRHAGKTFTFLVLVSIPFLLAKTVPFGARITHFIAALGILLLLQMVAFFQAYRFRYVHFSIAKKLLLWLPLEFAVWALLIFGGSKIGMYLGEPSARSAMAFLPAWIAFFGLLVYCRTKFILKQKQGQSERVVAERKVQRRHVFRGTIHAFVVRDILLLWRMRARSYFIPLIATVVSTAVVLAEDEASAALVSLIFVEAIFSFFLIKTVLTFFEWDAEIIQLIRSLPLKASGLWFARWLLAFGIIAAPAVLPLIVALVKFGPTAEFLFFALAALAILPAIMATIFCNGGFGLFPHFNLSGYIISISIIMIFLFWFFMPFGSFILLAVMVFWIRKSQKHFETLELQ